MYVREMTQQILPWRTMNIRGLRQVCLHFIRSLRLHGAAQSQLIGMVPNFLRYGYCYGVIRISS